MIYSEATVAACECHGCDLFLTGGRGLAAERASSPRKEAAVTVKPALPVLRRARTLTQEASWNKRAFWLVEEDPGDPQSTLCNLGPPENFSRGRRRFTVITWFSSKGAGQQGSEDTEPSVAILLCVSLISPHHP